MKAFVTGVTGYIGGSLAVALLKRGYEVRGLVRTNHHVKELGRLGVIPVLGSLFDTEIVAAHARDADLVVNAADADNAYVVSTLLDALKGTATKLLHVSGASVVGDRAGGAFSEHCWSEDAPPKPRLEKVGRVAIDHALQDAARGGVHSLVVCPTLVYGEGLGLRKQSIQIPLMQALARKHGVAVYAGLGENRTAHVHIQDLVSLCLLMIDKAAAGTFLYAENGEVAMKDLAQVLGYQMGFLAPAQSKSMAYLLKSCCFDDPQEAEYGLGSNIRVCADRARALGWVPKHSDLLAWLSH